MTSWSSPEAEKPYFCQSSRADEALRGPRRTLSSSVEKEVVALGIVRGRSMSMIRSS